MLSSKWDKHDMYGEILYPGDVCAYNGNGKVELVVYKKGSFGGRGSRFEFGQFITARGTRSLKFTSVAFAFDPMGKRRNSSQSVKQLIRNFYEGEKQ